MRYRAIALCICLCPAVGFTEIFKCNVNGRTVFTDQPCDDGERIQLEIVNTIAKGKTADFFFEPDFYSSNQWYEGATGYNKAKQLAETHQAPMIVYFYTDWCVYSNAVSTELLPQAASIDAMKPFVKVRMNPEKSSAEDTIFRSMGG